MNARLLSISLSLAVAMIAASTDVLSQGRGGGGGGMGGGRGGAVGGGMGGSQAGGMPSGMQRGNESAPAERPGNAQDRGNSASSDRQAPDQAHGKTPQELLKQNTHLSDNLAKLFPAGTDLQAASSGFKNLGEFVAAAHVSNNLGIPFADLKTRLLAGDSLGTAIHALKPGVDAQLEANRARARADEQLKRG